MYVDEFHHFATPSLSAILSGARKYRLGLVLAHQDLEQLRSRNPELLSAVLTNPAIRVCFRVGDLDASKLADGFSTFAQADLKRLGIGEAVCRVERSDWDFNLRTFPLEKIDRSIAASRSATVIAASRARYGTARVEVDPVRLVESGSDAPTLENSSRLEHAPPARTTRPRTAKPTIPVDDAASPLPGRGGPQHKYLQSLVKRLGEKRGFRVTIEKTVLDGHGHVDVALEREGSSVACEVSITTRVDHEIQNLTKCLAAGFDYAVLVSSDQRTLNVARSLLADAEDDRIRLLLPDDLVAFLDRLVAESDSVADAEEAPASEPANGPSQSSRSTAAPSEASDALAGASAKKKRLLTAKDAAAYVGLATQTLAKLRVSGGSPPYFKVGRQVMYDRADVDAWLTARRRRHTSDQPRPPAPDAGES